MVERSWKGCLGDSVLSKIAHVFESLVQWASIMFGDGKKKIKSAENRLKQAILVFQVPGPFNNAELLAQSYKNFIIWRRPTGMPMQGQMSFTMVKRPLNTSITKQVNKRKEIILKD